MMLMGDRRRGWRMRISVRRRDIQLSIQTVRADLGHISKLISHLHVISLVIMRLGRQRHRYARIKVCP